MASKLIRDKPEIPSPNTLISGEESPLTMADLIKQEGPIYRFIVDQILDDPAYIQCAKHLKDQCRALSRDNNPLEFDVEACSSAVKQVLESPQLMYNIKLFRIALVQLVSSLPVETETTAHDKFSIAYDIPLEESKTGGPPTIKGNLTGTDILQKLVEACRRSVTTIATVAKEDRNTYELVPGVDINVVDEWGRTGLHSACAKGKLKKAEFFISNGAAVDVPDVDRNTALHYAAGLGKEQCVELLIKNGACLTQKNSFGDTIYGIAELNHQTHIMKLLTDHGVTE